MGPALILDGTSGAGRTLGASGGRRIISAVTQLVIEIAENGRSIEEALAMPRIDSSGSQTVMHEFDAPIAESIVELDAQLIGQRSLPFELDFARANIAEFVPGGPARTAIEARAYDF
jgi:gamma-glutamyltranspeptidase/glutathione hydrolase